MENYLQLLEILAFFSGYPMLYILVKYLHQFKGLQRLTQHALAVLSYAYGVVGLLFLGLQLKTISLNADLSQFQHPYLVIWGILSSVFVFPQFSKKSNFSFLHSLVFFVILISKIIFQDYSQEEKSQVISNYMTIYSISLGLNLLLLLLAITFSLIVKKIK